VAQAEAALAEVRVLLLQLEVPLDAVIRAAQAARARGVTVILDPAPAQPLPPELYQAVDILTPNETETALLTGQAVTDAASAARAARTLRERGPRRVIIKMGGRGAYALDNTEGCLYAAPRVEVVDTVAAGDAFNGGLAVALAEGRPFQEAVRWGIAAGALSVTRAGAQAAMPSRAEVEALLSTL
jgi:ribokinase